MTMPVEALLWLAACGCALLGLWLDSEHDEALRKLERRGDEP